MVFLTRFLCEEEAASAVEYAVMLALILMVVLGAVAAVGAEGGGLWSGINEDLTARDSFGAGYGN